MTTAANAAPDAAASASPVGKRVARAPARRDEQHDDERGHLHDGLGRTEHAEDPAQQRAVDAGAGPCGGSRRARRAFGGSAPSASAGSRSVPMSRHEDLQHAERQREAAARERPHDERRELGDVVGEVVGEEAADVGERRPALLDRGDDGGEVVVEQHEVGGLAGDVGARAAHGDADVGLAAARGRR